jgi:WD40 repeat protein
VLASVTPASSPDGQQTTPPAVLLWDLGTEKLVAQFRGQMGRTAGAFSPDGQRIVTVLGKTAQIWDPNTGKMLMSLEGQESPVISAAFSPDGKRVVTGKLELIVAGQKANGIPDYASEKHPLTRPVVLNLFGGTYSAAFSPDGKRVVLASWDKTARIFDLEEREDAAVIRIDGREDYASFSPDGRQVAIASSELGRVNIWNIDASQFTATLDVPSVVKLAFSPDGQRLLTVGGNDTSPTARIWDLATNRTLMTIADESAGWSGSFSPDGLKILTAGKAVARI